MDFCDVPVYKHFTAELGVKIMKGGEFEMACRYLGESPLVLF